jgi:hypothetical protein
MLVDTLIYFAARILALSGCIVAKQRAPIGIGPFFSLGVAK